MPFNHPNLNNRVAVVTGGGGILCAGWKRAVERSRGWEER